MNKSYKVRPERIRSLRDIELEMARLRLEIMIKEEQIHSDYHHMLKSFTLRNLATVAMDDIAATSSVVSKALSLGRSFFSKRKKKKSKEREKQAGPSNPES